MGIYGSRFYFKEGLPNTRDVQEKFNEITGLELHFTTDLYLRKIADNEEDIIYHINRNKDEIAFSNSAEFDGDNAQILKENPRLATPYFHCPGFDDAGLADYSVEEKSFQIEYGTRSESLYFFNALRKTMYELGGLNFKYSIYPVRKDLIIEDYLTPYHPHDREWKSIKKWEEMSDFEKADFKSNHA